MAVCSSFLGLLNHLSKKEGNKKLQLKINETWFVCKRDQVQQVANVMVASSHEQKPNHLLFRV